MLNDQIKVDAQFDAQKWPSLRFEDIQPGMWLFVETEFTNKQQYFDRDVCGKAGDIGYVEYLYTKVNNIDLMTTQWLLQTFRGDQFNKAFAAYLAEGGLLRQAPPSDATRLNSLRMNLMKSDLSNSAFGRGYSRALFIGSDPELFCVDAKDVVIPAFTFLPDEATAKAQGSPYWDGFQAEWNIEPQYCHAWAMDAMQSQMQKLLTRLQQHNLAAKLTWRSVVDIPSDVMQAVDHKHTQLGCAPSSNIYNEVPLDVPDGRHIPFRFAGCHIHYGHGPMPDVEVANRVRAIDRILGPIMTSLLAGMEDIRRRLFYGRAGEYRLPPHGLEYRVPSSTILCHPIITHICFDIARMASYMGKEQVADLWEVPHEEAQVRHILNSLDVDEARSILKLNDKLLGELLKVIYTGQDSRRTNRVKAMILEGCNNHLPLTDMHANWSLSTKANPITTWRTHSLSANKSVATLSV